MLVGKITHHAPKYSSELMIRHSPNYFWKKVDTRTFAFCFVTKFQTRFFVTLVTLLAFFAMKGQSPIVTISIKSGAFPP